MNSAVTAANIASLPNTLQLPSTPSSAGVARRFVRDQAGLAGFDAETLYDIDVAVGEAVTNAIEHGDGLQPASTAKTVNLAVSVTDSFLIVEIQDWGSGFDLTTARHATPEDPYVERGRGMEIMRMLMDDVSIIPTPQGTIVRLYRRLPTNGG